MRKLFIRQGYMKKVLYVDDEAINRKLFSNLMKDYDVEVRLLEDGFKAMLVLEEEQFDLIFLDHIMPNMSGMELLTNIQAVEYNPNTYTPFVALTANPIENAEDLYIDAGFSAYMKKPIEKGAMETIMTRFLPGTKKEKRPKPAPEAKPEAAAVEVPLSEPLPISQPNPDQGLDAKAIEALFYSTDAAKSGPSGDAGPRWMEDTDCLDSEKGIRINGSLDDYMDVLRIFKDISKEKKKQLEDAFKEMNITDYHMLTHSLKSAAAVIGAEKLSKYAEFMEKACNNGDEETIKVDHEDFIKEYSKVISVLENNVVDSMMPTIGSLEYETEALKKSVLLISDKENICTRAMDNHLKLGKYKTDSCPPVPELAIFKADDAELVVYNMDNSMHVRKDFIKFLKEDCVEKGKGLIVVGEPGDYDFLSKELGDGYISEFHSLPLDIDAFMKSVNYYFDNYEVRSRLRHRILIVDDDEIYTTTIEHWLSGLYDITVANSAVEAISCVEKKKPDVILLDYEMPITDGPKFLEYIRMDESTANISVIFLTGSQDRGSVMKVLELAPNGYLLKSIDKNTLIERINTFFMTGSVGM